MKNLIQVLTILMMVSLASASGQIDISYAGYTISQPGSYIVVNDLHATTDQNAITIETSDVTIDLNGHTLYGAGTTVGTMGDGISASTSNNNITVTNGVIRDFRNNGIEFSGKNIQINSVKVMRNKNYGISMSGLETGENGIISNNLAEGNGGSGIYAGYGCTITNNSATANGGYGISTPGECTITNNSAYTNEGTGIYGGSGSLVIGNICNVNTGDGITTAYRSLVKNNVCESNSGDGIEVNGQSLVEGNIVGANSNGTQGRGINVTGSRNRIDSNHIVQNRIGINFGNASNWFGRNTFVGNSSAATTGSVPPDPGNPYNNQYF